jgi:hypothetical protein
MTTTFNTKKPKERLRLNRADCSGHRISTGERDQKI